MPAWTRSLLVAAVLATAVPATAQTPDPSGDQIACSPTVLTVLETWDKSLALADKWGEQAGAFARDKGRELLLPLLGIDPKSVADQDNKGAMDDLAKEVEASRNDPARRAALCVSITMAINDAKQKAGASVGGALDSLKRAIDGLKQPGAAPAAPPAAPPAPSGATTQTKT